MDIRNTKFGIEFGKKDICAVVVSYNPTMILLKNIEALKHQVANVIVIDNGSSDTEFLDAVENDYDIKVIKLNKNTGIAYALNIGLEQCGKGGYKLILTMDQDTILALSSVEALLKAMSQNGVVSVGINWDCKVKKNELVKYLITSGNLVSVDAANSIGGYNNKLFIDSVDFDFSLRLIDAGYKLMKVAEAKAEHNLGEEQGNTGYITHSVDRYYYIFRNHFYLCNKFWKQHPFFVAKKSIALVMDLISILSHDEEKYLKLRQLRNGWKAYKMMTKISG